MLQYSGYLSIEINALHFNLSSYFNIYIPHVHVILINFIFYILHYIIVELSKIHLLLESVSNWGEDTWHYHRQQPDMGRTRWWNNTKSRQEAVSTATTQTIRHSRWRPDGIYNGGPAYFGIRMSSMVDLTHIGSPKWYGASTKTCYEHHTPEHSLYRSISESTADFCERETCAVMWTFLHTNQTAAAQTA